MDSPPHRSWIPRPLVSVGLLLIATALTAAGWTYFHARDRLAAIDYVESAGGRIRLKGSPDWWPESAPIEFPTWLQVCWMVSIEDSSHCDLRRIAPLHELSRLDINCDVSDAEFHKIRHFENLECLNVKRAMISDAGLDGLRSCRRLRELTVRANHITDPGLQALAGLPLETLFLTSASISDDGLQHLADLPLTNLSLNGANITDAGLKHLVRMPLESLSLNRTDVTDAGLTHLARMPLAFLFLDGTGVTDAGIVALSHHSLELLSLKDTAVTATGLLVFSKMKSVTISVSSPNTSEDLRELQKAGIRVVLISKDGKYEAN